MKDRLILFAFIGAGSFVGTIVARFIINYINGG